MRQVVMITILLFVVNPLSAKENIEILADKRGVFDEVKGIIFFEGNVSAEKLSTGTTIFADRLEVYLDAKTRKPKKAKADGRVILVDREGSVFCDIALFKKANTSIELMGHVQVRTPELKLNGDRAYYNYETGRGRLSALPKKQVTFSFGRNDTKPALKGYTRPGKRSFQPQFTGQANEIIGYRIGKKAIMQGEVYIKDSINHSDLKAMRVELFFSPLEVLEEIIAIGDFLLVQNQRRFKADRAFFDYQQDMITLKGNASVEESGKALVTSSTIKMHMKENKGEIRSDGNEPIRSVLTID